MREQYVRILVPNYNPDPLSVKQFFQMQSFAKDVQTYLPYQSTTLLDFMSIAYNYCLKIRWIIWPVIVTTLGTRLCYF